MDGEATVEGRVTLITGRCRAVNERVGYVVVR